jgi:hypothetical protein
MGARLPTLTRAACGHAAAVVVLLTLASVGRGAAPKKPADDPDRGYRARAAAEVVGMREPVAALAMLMHGDAMWVWWEPDFARQAQALAGEAPPLSAELLLRASRTESNIDGRPLPSGLGKRPTDQWAKWERISYELFCQALRQAALASPEAFARSGRKNVNVTWGDLFRDPWRFRGDVIPMKGRLKRLLPRDTPVPVFKDGIKVFYEAWIFPKTPGTNPVCVAVLHLPPGLEPGEDLDVDVSFNGYFLQKYRYLTAGKGPRNTLLFVAPTLERRSPVGPTGGRAAAMWKAFLPWLLGLFAAVVFIVLGLSWWFRRDAARFHARVARMRTEVFQQGEFGPGMSPEVITSVRPEMPPEGDEDSGRSH